MRIMISDVVCDGPEQDRRVVEYRLSDGSRVTPEYVRAMIQHHGASFFHMKNGRLSELKIVHRKISSDGLSD